MEEAGDWEESRVGMKLVLFDLVVIHLLQDHIIVVGAFRSLTSPFEHLLFMLCKEDDD